MENLAIAKIRRDGGTQPRAALDEATIRDYAEAMQRGDTFPAVVVFFDGTDYWLADGFHRLAALESLGALNMDVPAIVQQGDQRAAVFFSTGVNAEHGLRRSNADKRRAVDVLLRDAEWGKWSDREIARQCKVSNNFVSELRKAICHPMTDSAPSPTSTERTVTRAGTTYTMNTAPIGPQRPAAQVVYLSEAKAKAKAEVEVEPTGPAVGVMAQQLVPAVWQFVGCDPEASSPTRLAEAKRLTGSLLNLEGFHARAGRNYDWEALIGRVGAQVDHAALRRAVEMVRAIVMIRLGAAVEIADEAQPQPAPEPEAEPDLAAVVIRWLAEKVEENAIPEGVEESRYVLRKILTDRNNGFALAWRELKTQAHWPAGTQDGAKLDAVKAALAQLGGEVPQPPAAPERVYVRPDVVPTTAQAMNEVDRLNKKLRELVELNAKQAERINEQRTAINRALRYLKRLAVAKEEAIDDDLIETIAALEAAR